MKKKVLTGEIFKFKCNKCGCEARINYSSLYHQMEDRIMIYYVQDEEDYESACNMFSGEDMPEIFEDLMAEKYLYRIVTSPGELREKIIIFDNGRRSLKRGISHLLLTSRNSISYQSESGHSIRFTGIIIREHTDITL